MLKKYTGYVANPQETKRKFFTFRTEFTITHWPLLAASESVKLYPD
jgi:hypothetical protein